jgi:hypothetical protein
MPGKRLNSSLFSVQFVLGSFFGLVLKLFAGCVTKSQQTSQKVKKRQEKSTAAGLSLKCHEQSQKLRKRCMLRLAQHIVLGSEQKPQKTSADTTKSLTYFLQHKIS